MSDLKTLLRSTASDLWVPPHPNALWGLSVFPIYRRPTWNPGPRARGLRYTPLSRALEKGEALIEELPDAHVPEIVVCNPGQGNLLAVDGDELLGGKQNRILNVSVLLGHGSTKIPVSCVERKRWRHNSQHFSSGERSSYDVRRSSHSSVSLSLIQRNAYVSDQRAIWANIERGHSEHGVTSETSSMHALYEAKKAVLSAYVDALGYAHHAVGLAIGIGGKLTGLDLFDKAATCEFYWPRLIRAAATDALRAEHQVPQLLPLLDELRRCDLQAFDSPGLGQDVRFDGPVVQGAALVHQDTVVHLSMFKKEA